MLYDDYGLTGEQLRLVPAAGGGNAIVTLEGYKKLLKDLVERKQLRSLLDAPEWTSLKVYQTDIKPRWKLSLQAVRARQGENWKEDLCSMWEASRYLHCYKAIAATLQEIRNLRGPSWLDDLTEDDLN